MVENPDVQRGLSGFITLEASGNKTVVEGSLLTEGHLKQTDQNKQQKFKNKRQRKWPEFMFFGLSHGEIGLGGSRERREYLRGWGGRWQFPSFLGKDFPGVKKGHWSAGVWGRCTEWWQNLVGGLASLLVNSSIPTAETQVTARVWGCATTSKSRKLRRPILLFCCLSFDTWGLCEIQWESLHYDL